MGKVSIVGAGMRSHPGVAAKVFGVLAEEGVNIDMISTSPIKISCVIDRDRVEQAVQALHSAFELSGEGTIAGGGALSREPGRLSARSGGRVAGAALPERCWSDALSQRFRCKPWHAGASGPAAAHRSAPRMNTIALVQDDPGDTSSGADAVRTVCGPPFRYSTARMPTCCAPRAATRGPVLRSTAARAAAALDGADRRGTAARSALTARRARRVLAPKGAVCADRPREEQSQAARR